MQLKHHGLQQIGLDFEPLLWNSFSPYLQDRTGQDGKWKNREGQEKTGLDRTGQDRTLCTLRDEKFPYFSDLRHPWVAGSREQGEWSGEKG